MKLLSVVVFLDCLLGSVFGVPYPSTLDNRVILRSNCHCPLDAMYKRRVCGWNGQTYWSACYAGCAGTKIKCEGFCPCPPANQCPNIYSPVCASNGITYTNRCKAQKIVGLFVDCMQPCPCPKKCSICCRRFHPKCLTMRFDCDSCSPKHK